MMSSSFQREKGKTLRASIKSDPKEYFLAGLIVFSMGCLLAIGLIFLPQPQGRVLNDSQTPVRKIIYKPRIEPICVETEYGLATITDPPRAEGGKVQNAKRLKMKGEGFCNHF